MTIKRKTLLLAGAAAAIWLLGGCALPFAILEKMFPKEKIPARFVLPAGKRVLVFPDDMLHPVGYPPVKRVLARRLGELLAEHELVAETIAYDSLVDLRNAETDFNRMAVATVGRRLGAELVVYVSIDGFSLKDMPVDTLWRGRFSCKVRVVDVRNGRLWPDESAGFPVKVVEPIAENTSEAYGAELADKLAKRLAEGVCGLFHEHYVDRARPKEKDTDSVFGE